MPDYCTSGDKAVISYSLDGSDYKFETKQTPIKVEETTSQTIATSFGVTGKSVTVPSDWDGAEVWLFGTKYTAPNYPNCPSGARNEKVGEASPNQS
jgi:hypothetical protein